MAKKYNGSSWVDCANRVLKEGTDTATSFPATPRTAAAGNVDYKIYGNTGGVGEQTANLWDESWVKGAYNSYGAYVANPNAVASDPDKPIPVQGGMTYYIKQFKNVSKIEVFFYRSATGGFIRYDTIDPDVSNSFVSPQSANYMRFGCYRGYGTVYANDIVISTAFPTAYVPHGYQIPLTNASGVTENLWDENYENISTSLTYKPMNVGNGSFTLSTNTPLGTGGSSLFLMPGQQSSGASTPMYGAYDGSPRTVTSVDGYVTLVYRIYDSKDPRVYQAMLTKGSTAPDHYLPHRYTADYNLYIGDTKLGAEEYVDSETGKIYKRNPASFLWFQAFADPQSDKRFLYSIAWTEEDRPNLQSDVGLVILRGQEQIITRETEGVTAVSIDQERISDYLYKSGVVRDLGEGCNFRTFVKIGDEYFYGESLHVIYDEVVAAPNEEILLDRPAVVLPHDPPVPLPEITLWAGDNSLSFETTVQPEKAEVTFTGWHDAEIKF